MANKGPVIVKTTDKNKKPASNSPTRTNTTGSAPVEVTGSLPSISSNFNKPKPKFDAPLPPETKGVTGPETFSGAFTPPEIVTPVTGDIKRSATRERFSAPLPESKDITGPQTFNAAFVPEEVIEPATDPTKRIAAKPKLTAPTPTQTDIYVAQGTQIINVDNNTIIIETPKEVYINTIDNSVEQKFISNYVGSTSGYSGPGGLSGQLQFNANGEFGGVATASYDGSTLNLGDNTNVKLYGGYSGNLLQTDGSGNLTWASITSFSGYSGRSGYSGYQGASGFSGYSGQDGVSGFSGYSGDSTSGYSGISGFSGDSISGYSGYSGDIGISGFSGISGWSGQPGDTNLIWTESGVYRTLTAYRSVDDTVAPVRTAEFYNNLLRLTLASFTPTLSSTPTPGSPLNWDIPVTAFNVSVGNPDDILVDYISDVLSLTATTGTVAPLSSWTAGAKSATPGPTIDWTQTFTADGTGYLRSNSATIAGGSAVVNVYFSYFNGTSTVPYLSGNAVLTVNWNTPTMTTTLGTLSGNTFLQTYASVPYTITITGVTNSGNYSNSITPTGGVISNPNGSGTFTFTTPINKDNTGTTRTIANTTTFTRPATVTGVSYSSSLSATTSNPAASFTYPSLWVWTASTFVVPIRSTYVLGNGFQPGVTVLGNQVKIFSAYVNNTDVVPRGFWFAVRTSASQPTVFKTGASPSLLSDVTVTTGNSVNLEPDSPPVGYIAEPYTLYGITLQPGSTYVSIS